MARRIEVELTSQKDDGTWTWRAAGAKQPRGVVGGDLLPSETVLGTVQDGGSYPDLHPDPLAPLARLIVRASARTQVWLVTHSERLADAILAEGAERARAIARPNLDAVKDIVGFVRAR